MNLSHYRTGKTGPKKACLDASVRAVWRAAGLVKIDLLVVVLGNKRVGIIGFPTSGQGGFAHIREGVGYKMTQAARFVLVFLTVSQANRLRTVFRPERIVDAFDVKEGPVDLGAGMGLLVMVELGQRLGNGAQQDKHQHGMPDSVFHPLLHNAYVFSLR